MGKKRHRVWVSEKANNIIDDYAIAHSITKVEASHRIILKNSKENKNNNE